MRKLFLTTFAVAYTLALFAQVDTSMNGTYRNNMPNNGMNNNLNTPTTPNNNGSNNNSTMPNNGMNNNGTMPNKDDMNRRYNDNLRLDSMRNGLYGGSESERMRLEGTSKTYSDRMRDSLRNMYGDRMRMDSTPNRNNSTTTTEQQLRDGYYNGQKIRSDTIRDGRYNRYDKMTIKQRDKADASQNPAIRYDQNSAMSNNAMASNEKYIMMHNGKVMMMKNGRTITIKAYTPLDNGAKVTRDGSIVQKDGTITTLKEGECINSAGSLVEMPNMDKMNLKIDKMKSSSRRDSTQKMNRMDRMRPAGRRDSMQRMNTPKM
jgi:hypothetical protein